MKINIMLDQVKTHSNTKIQALSESVRFIDSNSYQKAISQLRKYVFDEFDTNFFGVIQRICGFW